MGTAFVEITVEERDDQKVYSVNLEFALEWDKAERALTTTIRRYIIIEEEKVQFDMYFRFYHLGDLEAREWLEESSSIISKIKVKTPWEK